jgi:hypothetical protein
MLQQVLLISDSGPAVAPGTSDIIQCTNLYPPLPPLTAASWTPLYPEEYFVKPDTVDRIRASWIGPQVERYVGWLAGQGLPYDPETKGGSEATVRVAKADLVPAEANLLEAYGSFGELAQACAAFCDVVNGRVHRETVGVEVVREPVLGVVGQVATTEHRVIQLRRADDFVSGRTSHTLVHQELQATTELLDEAALTEDQTRRLLTATGELAQLAAWVAADAGLYKQAASYTEGGVLAAHAADNEPLAANIISTLSYQLGEYRQSPASRFAHADRLCRRAAQRYSQDKGAAPGARRMGRRQIW